MQIDIDFQVFKALTALRQSESDSYNAVIRRVLGLSSTTNALLAGTLIMPKVGESNALAGAISSSSRSGPVESSAQSDAVVPDEALGGFLANYMGGIWFGNVHFPEGTKFRATYKGQTYYAEVKDRQWVGADGVVRRSPSDAASAISNTNVNGWRFWHVQMPGDPAWRKLDELKQ